jgi:hypothetical protein
MPTEQIVQLLIAERDRLNRAIDALQGPTKRRGRPPGSKNGVAAAATTLAPATKRGRRTFTAAQRKAQAARMRRYWAEKKKKTGKGV